MSTKLPFQFSRALREEKYSACSGHSILEGNTISSVKFRGYQTTPPPKTSYLAGEEPRYSSMITPKESNINIPPIQIFMLAAISGVMISLDISGKC